MTSINDPEPTASASSSPSEGCPHIDSRLTAEGEGWRQFHCRECSTTWRRQWDEEKGVPLDPYEGEQGNCLHGMGPEVPPVFRAGDRVRQPHSGDEYTVLEGPFTAYRVHTAGEESDLIRADLVEPIPPADPRVDVVAKALSEHAGELSWSETPGYAQEGYRASARKALAAMDAETDGPLVHVGYYCWLAGCEHQDGHLADTLCRSDSVPIYVPTKWEKDMRGVMDDD